MRERLTAIFYSFPVQLFLLHLKRHHIFLFFWVFLTLCVTGVFAKNFGIMFLFVDPEYLGNVSFTSFLLLGGAFGAFLMAWNIASYILNAYQFPFLATARNPFGNYCINNSLTPLIFIAIYVYRVVVFQNQDELHHRHNLL